MFIQIIFFALIKKIFYFFKCGIGKVKSGPNVSDLDIMAKFCQGGQTLIIISLWLMNIGFESID